MGNGIREFVREFFIKHTKKCIAFSILFLAGMVLAGIFCSKTIPEEEIRSYIKEFIQTGKNLGTDGAKTFLLSMSQYLKFAFFMAVFSMTVIGVPLIFGMTVLSGFSYGAVLFCLFRIFGAKAILLIFCAIFPHIVISLPCCLCLSCVSLNNAGQVYAGNVRFSKTILYPIVYCLIFLCAVSVAALIQGFIEPFLLKVISTQFL